MYFQGLNDGQADQEVTPVAVKIFDCLCEALLPLLFPGVPIECEDDNGVAGSTLQSTTPTIQTSNPVITTSPTTQTSNPVITTSPTTQTSNPVMPTSTPTMPASNPTVAQSSTTGAAGDPMLQLQASLSPIS